MSGENVAYHQPENDGDVERAEGDGWADVGGRRAPTRPEERRSWKLVFKLAGFHWEKRKSILRVNPCIRSLVVSQQVIRRSNGFDIVASRQGFPYPDNFLSGQRTRYHLTRELRDGPYTTTTLETDWTSIQPNTQETETQTAQCVLTREIREGPYMTTLKTLWTTETQPARYKLTRETRKGPHVTTTLETGWTTETQTARYKLTQETREGPHVTTTLETDWATETQTAQYQLTQETREAPHITTLKTIWAPSQPNSQGTETQTANCQVTRETREGRHVTTSKATWRSPYIQEAENQAADRQVIRETRVGPYVTTRNATWRSPYIQEAETQAADYGLSRHIPQFELALTSLRTQSEITLTGLRTQSENTLADLRRTFESNLTDLRTQSENTLVDLRRQFESNLTDLRAKFDPTQTALRNPPRSHQSTLQTGLSLPMFGFKSLVSEATFKNEGNERKGIRREISLTTPIFEFRRLSEINSETRVSQIYVALGIFSKVNGRPQETIIFVQNPRNLFWKLHWGIISLRGLSGFFSLRGIKAFHLYKVRRPDHPIGSVIVSLIGFHSAIR